MKDKPQIMDLEKIRAQLEELQGVLLMKMSQEDKLNFGNVRMLAFVSESLRAIDGLEASESHHS